jgi:NADPH-dependent 2,4-dienoyl-CoA reductase/sulfur reductase-like enzyme
MEAALRLKARGHEPILIERSDTLGGAFTAAAAVYEPNGRYLGWLRREIAGAAIDARLGMAATPDILSALEPDTVIVATGAGHPRLAIPGIDKAHVEQAETFRDIGDGTHVGRTVAIIGGGVIGLELAEWLAAQGKTVTIIDSDAKLGAGLPIVRRARLLIELRQKRVALIAGVRDVAIEDSAIVWSDVAGQTHRTQAESVIIADGGAPDQAFAGQLSEAGFTVLSAGDCAGDFTLEQSIRVVADLVDRL